jgi:hypothetical protein
VFVRLVGILSEMHSVVSWRDSLPNDALLEVHAWLDRGDPDAGVKAVAVRHMIGGVHRQVRTGVGKDGTLT